MNMFIDICVGLMKIFTFNGKNREIIEISELK